MQNNICKVSCKYKNKTHTYSVQFRPSVVSDSLRPHVLQHTRPPRPSPTPGVHPNPCPLSQWCHPAISSSVVPFSSSPQPFQASGLLSFLSCSTGQNLLWETSSHKSIHSDLNRWTCQQVTRMQKQSKHRVCCSVRLFIEFVFCQFSPTLKYISSKLSDI